MAHYKTCLALREEHSGPKALTTVRVRLGVAQCELDLGYLEAIRDVLERCKKDFDATNSDGKKIAATIWLYQSLLAQRQNNQQKALSSINRALELCQEGWEMKPNLLEVRKTILAQKKRG
ncbi:MAG: hypothetical protein K2X93_03425 [Candidatus Obscuribacterales bacterium]|nr:hypothetical protein [Candidatus Obscuribacterales bacterium]